LDQYYFTVSSLPFLSFSQKPLISVAYFIQMCVSQLKPADYAILEKADYNRFHKAEALPLLKKWFNWEATLRNTLARLRGKQKALSVDKYIKQAEDDIEAITIGNAAFGEASPVKAEELIDKARWRFLEELEQGHYFDLTRVISYYLKLQILEKRFAEQADKGKEKYNTMMNTFYNTIADKETNNGK